MGLIAAFGVQTETARRSKENNPRNLKTQGTDTWQAEAKTEYAPPLDTIPNAASHRDISTPVAVPRSEGRTEMIHNIAKHVRHFSPKVSVPG